MLTPRILLVALFPFAAFAQTPPTLPTPSPAPYTPYALEDAFPGLKFDQPLGIVSAPGEKHRLFVLEKTGRIQAITGLDGQQPAKQLFLDLTSPMHGELDSSGECGVLGLAFPFDFAKSRRCFVYYSLFIDKKLHQRVSRFRLSADLSTAIVTREQPLWSQLDPANNHNGGDLQFGPDGYLYISLGDGGAADDKFDRARFINKDFHGAILRLDVDKRPGNLQPNPHPGLARDGGGETFYAIPADNPFVGATSHHGKPVDPQTVRTEIWATGLRNPWRISFDPKTGRLFAADVGQNLYEEVNLITKGGDYGWSYREALHSFDKGPGKNQPPADYKPVDPVFEYPRVTGLSITGGVVYHGDNFPKLRAAYIFADYATGNILALREQENTWASETLAKEIGIAGIGLDPRNGDVLFANLAQGKIQRLKPAPAPAGGAQ
jgi:glucose/arabinose dehydrogenase